MRAGKVESFSPWFLSVDTNRRVQVDMLAMPNKAVSQKYRAGRRKVL